MKNKKGNSLIISPVVTVFSLIILISVFVTIINYSLPFIWYEKLNVIAQKYVYVIEKFGTLTENEKKDLEIDLINRGFDIDKIKIKIPDEKMPYGDLFEFSLNYQYKLKEVTIKNGIIGYKERLFPLTVNKYGYIKNKIN